MTGWCRASALVVLVGATGCSPFGGGSFACDEDADCAGGANAGKCILEVDRCAFANAECPSMFAFDDGTCVGGDTPMPDAPDDTCYGADAEVCTNQPLAMTIVLSGVIDTATSAMCAADVAAHCVIVADRIEVPVNMVASGIGARPLVLLANTIAIDGVLDVASHRGTQVGAAADDASCGVATAPTATTGGGAGGTFGALGGAGGGATMPSTPAPVGATDGLRGGCPGLAGVGAVFGVGGHGGGAVYLIAITELSIAGAINASGEGGSPALSSSSGGGGGGSGGMIRIHAPTILSSGVVFANGGGGGEGSGSSTAGVAGGESINGAVALGGNGPSSNGGNGGNGGDLTTPDGGPGLDGLNGDGAGGGGVGVIRVTGGGTLTGTVSPNPS